MCHTPFRPRPRGRARTGRPGARCAQLRTDSGQRQLSLQRRVISERQVRIRRLFLLDEDADEDAVPPSLLAPHQAIGVGVRVLQPSKLHFLLRTDMPAGSGPADLQRQPEERRIGLQGR